MPSDGGNDVWCGQCCVGAEPPGTPHPHELQLGRGELVTGSRWGQSGGAAGEMLQRGVTYFSHRLCSPVTPRVDRAQIRGCPGWICTQFAAARWDMPFSRQGLGLAP